MKYNLIKIFNIIFVLTFSLGSFLFFTPKPVEAALELVKSVEFGTVYYIDARGIRHPFPNLTTYKSWYGDNFSRVVAVSTDVLKNYPIGPNITIRPGTFLIKIRTAPEVYAIEQGGVLRELQNESIAAGIYGEDWSKKVVDVPDIFFENYSIGQPIVHDYTIPDSILYFDEFSQKYFYYNNGILQQFKSTNDVLENNFTLGQALSANRSYYKRERPIVGRDDNVFNLMALPIIDTRDCVSKKLKAAVIIVADKDVSGEEIDKLQTIKKSAPEHFTWATDYLSEINFDYPTTILLDDGYLIKKRNDGTTEVRNEVLNTFFDNNPDEFDFVFIWTNFTVPSEANSNEIARFIPVTNLVEGINKPQLNRANVYGSTGKLKGIIMMGNINKYKVSSQPELNKVLNIVTHELGHNSSAYINFTDANNNLNSDLINTDNLGHWNLYDGFISPLGGSGWKDNGDGTYANGLLDISDSGLRKYSDLDLYLMGLKPAQFMEDVFYLKPEVEGSLGNTISAVPVSVSMDEIIKANGKRWCNFK